MAKGIESIPEAIPSMDCPAAPFVDDFEDKVITRLETFGAASPVSEALIKLSKAC